MRTFKKKHPALFGVIIGCVIAASTAAAAWVVFSGASGQGGAQVGTSQISSAITLVPQYDGTAVVPGTDGQIKANIVNNDTVAHTLTSLTAGTITATPPCNTGGLSYLSSGTLPITVPAGGTVFDATIGTIHAAANLDPSCSNAQIQIAFTGTTS